MNLRKQYSSKIKTIAKKNANFEKHGRQNSVSMATIKY